MRVSVVPALFGGDAIDDVRRVARWASATGAAGVWISEVAGYDAVGLAVAVAPDAGQLEVLLGPVSPSVRDPALLAMALATVAETASGPVALVLGASSPNIVSGWHGRSFAAPIATMETAVAAVRAALVGDRTDHHGGAVASEGFRLQAALPGDVPVVVAGQGERMLRLAGAIADRVVVNLVTPAQAAEMVAVVAAGASAAGRLPPPVAVWLTTGAIEPSRGWVADLLGTYAAAPGYRDRFAEAGLLDRAGRLSDEAVDRLCAFGDGAAAARTAEYAAAGIAEVALVMSGRDPAGAAILNQVTAAAADLS